MPIRDVTIRRPEIRDVNGDVIKPVQWQYNKLTRSWVSKPHNLISASIHMEVIGHAELVFLANTKNINSYVTFNFKSIKDAKQFVAEFTALLRLVKF